MVPVFPVNWHLRCTDSGAIHHGAAWGKDGHDRSFLVEKHLFFPYFFFSRKIQMEDLRDGSFFKRFLVI